MYTNKAKIIFILVVLFAILFACKPELGSIEGEQMNRSIIESQAQEYLNDHYSAAFEIVDCHKASNSPGPIPIGTYHWVLNVKSNQFPGESFYVFYRENANGNWYWSDNYYSLLLRSQANSKIMLLATDFFAVDCLVETLWRIDPWPDGIGEDNSFSDWLAAGGHCPTFCIYLRGITPESDLCQLFTNLIYTSHFSVNSISFRGLSCEGFDVAHADNSSLKNMWNEHPEWRLGYVYCSTKEIREDENDG